VVLNHALMKGVAESNGEISIAMLNKLSNSQNLTELPAALLPEMRQIMYGGLHHIMLIALILLIIAFIFNIGIQAKMKKRQAI